MKRSLFIATVGTIGVAGCAGPLTRMAAVPNAALPGARLQKKPHDTRIAGPNGYAIVNSDGTGVKSYTTAGVLLSSMEIVQNHVGDTVFFWWRASNNETDALLLSQFDNSPPSVKVGPYDIVPIDHGSKVYRYGVLLYTVTLQNGDLDIADHVANQTVSEAFQSPNYGIVVPNISLDCAKALLEFASGYVGIIAGILTSELGVGIAVAAGGLLIVAAGGIGVVQNCK